MITRKCFVLIITILIVMAGIASASEQIFTFAPPVSKSFEQHVYTIHARFADDQKGLTDSTKAFYHMEYVPSPIGFDLVSVPDSIMTIRNGQPIDNPISAAMAKTTSRMVLDDTGHCLSIEGYDKLTGNLVVDDSSLYEEIVQNLNPEAIAVKESGEWNSLIDPLVGVSAEIGNIANLQGSFRVGINRSIELFTQIECVDTFRVDGIFCARVYFHSDSDFERLAERRKVIPEKLKADFDYDELPAKSDQVDAMRIVQLVLEVPTMKILGVMLRSQTTLNTSDDSDTPHAVRLIETKDMRFFHEPIK